MRDLDLTDLGALEVRAASAEIVEWAGRKALRLENGAAIFRDLTLAEAGIEVDIATEGAAYAGLAFRAAGAGDMELAYVQPHTSGLWDAIQYDPVFNGVNTWQVFNGPRYQKQADVPTGLWFRLRVDIAGQRAAVAVSSPDCLETFQPALTIGHLAHDRASGRVGVWTFLPAYFTGLRVGPPVEERLLASPHAPLMPPGTVSEWLIEGAGPLRVEENGTLNLNRYLSQAAMTEVVVWREFAALRHGPLALTFGYSDELELYVDRQLVFSGMNTFAGTDATRRSRGYIEPTADSLIVQAAPGRHVLSARVRASEPFGWGLNLALAGDGIELLPIVG